MSTDLLDDGAEVSSADLAYERIRQAIVEGRYGPGQRLVEQRLGEELELSRTPVREALQRLVVEGLVLTERNRSAVVRPLSASDIEDVYVLRVRLESLAAELAAARATPEQVHELRSAAGGFEAAIEPVVDGTLDNTRALNASNQRFHDTVVRAADHRRLEQLLVRAVDIPLVFQAFRHLDDEQLRRSALFHHLIADAIAGADPDRAGRLMTEHILQGRDVLLAALSSPPAV